MREVMDQDGMTRLVESIALLGVIEPIVVAPLESGRLRDSAMATADTSRAPSPRRRLSPQ